MNVNFPIGSIVLIDKIDDEFDFFDSVFGKICEKARGFKENIKLLMNNKISRNVSINQILNVTPKEEFGYLGSKNVPGERSIYRTIERVGENSAVILEKYHLLLKKHNLISNKQLMDWSSTYFEGNKSEILNYILNGLLKAWHPFMPFVTEEIYSKLPINGKKLLLVEEWPLTLD